MREAVLGLPDQLRWAASLDPGEIPAADTVLVAGMGGSGISGDVATLLAGEAGTFCTVHKGYGLPAWAQTQRPLLVAVSYSGNTEETLSVVEEAAAAGLEGVAVSTGGRLAEVAAAHQWPHLQVPAGLQPRAALGYLAGTVARVLEAAGAAPAQGPALTEAAAVAAELLGPDLTGPAAGLSADLAEGLGDRIALIYGGQGLGAVAAQRWKTQLNENAKWPAFWNVIPELNHNEIVGWGAIPQLTRRDVGIISLRDRGEPARVGRRFELTAEIIAADVGIVGEVSSQGQSILARLISLLVVADALSLELAARKGIDPLPVEPIDKLKRSLA